MRIDIDPREFISRKKLDLEFVCGMIVPSCQHCDFKEPCDFLFDGFKKVVEDFNKKKRNNI